MKTTNFSDINGHKLSKGDIVMLTIVGLGTGQAVIEEHENELCLYESSQGYYPLKYAINREDIIIEKIT